MPTILVKSKNQESKEFEGFPVNHYSYSMFSKFSSDPQMFKVGYINGDRFETTVSPTNVIGKSCHEGLKVYFEKIKEGIEMGEAIKMAHDKAKLYLDSYSDGFIGYNATIADNRAKLEERFAFAFFGYIKEMGSRNIKEILLIEKMLQYKIEINEKLLPIPLKGSADLVVRSNDEKLRIYDHKFTTKFSDSDSIDAGKLLQAVFNYFLVWAELGERPYSIVFEEFKITKNQNNGPQLKEYEIVFEDNTLMFDLFYRFYDDITNALLGKQVYIPNIYGIYDREVSLLSYIHKLDIAEEREKQFKAMKVDNVTDFLKKKIQKTGAMKKYLDSVSKNFVSGKTLNYKEMKTHEKIKFKLAEHGLGVEFVDQIDGFNVSLYRFEPSIGLKMSKIEAYVKDIEQVMAVSGIRILAPIPNSDLIGFEIPNKERTFPDNNPVGMGFDLALGVDVMGDTYRIDIRKLPHLLVSGTTNSGKSVCISSLIKQLKELDKNEVFLTLLDPKMVELQSYSSGSNVFYESDIKEIRNKLKHLCESMNARYKDFQEKGVKNIGEYNDKFKKIPYNFVFIEEFGDIIVSDVKEIIKVPTGKKRKNGEPEMKNETINISEEIKKYIIILAQKARAAGIHLIITTQRPSVKIISGEIKANFAARIAFKTASATDSNIILDQPGAEKLLGKGDMLVLNPVRQGLERLQGFNLN